MTVGQLKKLLQNLDDEMLVVTDEYNSGYGGLFEAGAETVTPKPADCLGDEPVLAIGRSFG